MATFTKNDNFCKNLQDGKHKFGSSPNTYALCLTNTGGGTHGATTFTAGTTDLATANGYTQGGKAIIPTSSLIATSQSKVVMAGPDAGSACIWTATGAVGPFQYAFIVDTTANAVVGEWNYGSAVTLASGDTFTVTFDASNGIFQLA